MTEDERAEARTHDSRTRAREGDYRSARIGSAITLTLVVATIVILDAIDHAYEVSPVVLTALLATIAALLSIEARSIMGRK